MTSTLNEIVLEGAMRCGAAFASTCSAAGTTTTLSDVQARDQGTDANFAAGGWIYRPDAADDTDKVRRISSAGFDPATGTWTPTRAWTNEPEDDEAYQVYAILPPLPQPGMSEDWRRLVNRALSAIWFRDEIVIGSGDGSLGGRFVLSNEVGWVANKKQVVGVMFRRTDSSGIVTDVSQSLGGRDWDIISANGQPTLTLLSSPTTEQDVVLEVLRTYPPLTADTDTTDCPLDLVALRMRYELFRHLDATPAARGQYIGEAAIAFSDFQAEYLQHRPEGGIRL